MLSGVNNPDKNDTVTGMLILVNTLFQMPASTAKPLIAAGYDCLYRGNLHIKGKQQAMTTYLLAPVCEKGDASWLLDHVIKEEPPNESTA